MRLSNFLHAVVRLIAGIWKVRAVRKRGRKRKKKKDRIQYDCCREFFQTDIIKQSCALSLNYPICPLLIITANINITTFNKISPTLPKIIYLCFCLLYCSLSPVICPFYSARSQALEGEIISINPNSVLENMEDKWTSKELKPRI